MSIAAFVTGGIGPDSTIALFMTRGLGIGVSLIAVASAQNTVYGIEENRDLMGIGISHDIFGKPETRDLMTRK